MKKALNLLLVFIISSIVFSCIYKNSSIPDLEKITIDTIMTTEDTSGFIYGRIYYDGAELGSIFQVFTTDFFANNDSILSVTTAYKNQRLFIYMNDTSLGVYNASTNISLPKTCLVLFDANATNLIDPLVALNVGNITLSSYDTTLRVYRGTINVANVGAAKTYDIRGSLAFKMRN